MTLACAGLFNSCHAVMYTILSCDPAKLNQVIGRSDTICGALSISKAYLERQTDTYDVSIHDNSHGPSRIVCFSDGLMTEPEYIQKLQAEFDVLRVALDGTRMMLANS